MCVLTGKSVHVSAEICDLTKKAFTFFKITYLFKVSHTQLHVLDFEKCHVRTLILKLNILFVFDDVAACILHFYAVAISDICDKSPWLSRQ